MWLDLLDRWKAELSEVVMVAGDYSAENRAELLFRKTRDRKLSDAFLEEAIKRDAIQRAARGER